MAGTNERFVVVADAALILDYGEATEAVVKGLNKMKLYDLTRERISIQEFRQDFSRTFNGGMNMGDMEFGGSLILGDKLGQNAARKRMLDNTISTGDRFYLNYTNSSLLESDFVACDLANDPDTNGWQISKFTPSSVGMNQVIEFDAAIAMNGRPAIFDTHYTASMTITEGTGSTVDCIEDAAAGFVTAGFYAGQTILFEGTGAGANDGDMYVCTVVVPGKIKLTAVGDVTTVTPGASFTIHGGAL